MGRMARPHRAHLPDGVVHVVNRGNERRRLFDGPPDYEEFLRILDRALARRPTRLLAYALMPNHWHLVLWPESSREMSQFLHYLTTLHAVRFRQTSGTAGAGHVYQGRFHATSVERDMQYWLTLRYVEANPLRAGLVARAEHWPWTSLSERAGTRCRIVDGPLPMPPSEAWLKVVNAAAGVVGPPRPRFSTKSGSGQNGV